MGEKFYGVGSLTLVNKFWRRGAIVKLFCYSAERLWRLKDERLDCYIVRLSEEWKVYWC